MQLNKNILWLDCTAALLASVLVLSFPEWLSALYAMPENLLLFIGAVNLLYACYSFSLAIRARRPLFLIKLLAVANASWALMCIAIFAKFAGSLSLWGGGHLLGEALFVGGLAALEWRWRKQLLTAA